MPVPSAIRASELWDEGKHHEAVEESHKVLVHYKNTRIGGELYGASRIIKKHQAELGKSNGGVQGSLLEPNPYKGVSDQILGIVVDVLRKHPMTAFGSLIDGTQEEVGSNAWTKDGRNKICNVIADGERQGYLLRHPGDRWTLVEKRLRELGYNF